MSVVRVERERKRELYKSLVSWILLSTLGTVSDDLKPKLIVLHQPWQHYESHPQGPRATENSGDKSETLIKDIHCESNTDMNEGKHGCAECFLLHETPQ